MLTLTMTAEQVGLFSARFVVKEPKCRPLWDGTSLMIPDEFAASARELYDQGFAHTMDELKAHAAYARFMKEVAGITVDGASIATDRESQARVIGAALQAAADPKFKTQWKTKDGKFVTLDAPKVIAMATAVAKHVADCFAAEASMNGSIFSGALTSKEQIDATINAIKS